MPPQRNPDDIEAAAAAWLARRDRGLTAAEQDAFLEWRRADPRHVAALARLEKTWSTLDGLAAEWLPTHSGRPNPDLLAAPRPARRRLRWLAPVALAAAAAVALGLYLRSAGPKAGDAPRVAPRTVTRVAPPASVLTHSGLVRHESQRMTLPDGSVIDLNAGAKVEVAYAPDERRVRLANGEAHFTVAKNLARPFIVAAGGVAVRAVGTAFSVQLSDVRVSVLVTEGRVRVDAPPAPGTPPREAAVLVSGQRAVIETAAPAAPDVSSVSAAEIEHALAWQGVRLEFIDMPLAEVAAAFNLHNRRQLVIGDPATGAVRVGGNFHADNVDAFVRLLESSFGIAAETRADGTAVLRCRRNL